jgi:hypothetical protein
LHRYRHRLAAVCDACHSSDDEERKAVKRLERVGEIALSTVQVERQALIRLRDEGRIGDDVVRKLERELDLEEARQVRA